MVNKASDDIFLGVSDLNEYITSTMVRERNDLQLETFFKSFGIYSTRKQWSNFTNELSNLRCVQSSEDNGYFFDDEQRNYVEYSIHPTHISIRLIGDDLFIEDMNTVFDKHFDFVTNQIEWMYSGNGDSIEIPLRHDRMPLKEMYPFLGDRTLEEYYDDFMSSDASILLLIGPPGTGKTTFIRGMLQHTNSSAIVTYDAGILEKDFVFANFIEGDKSIMVLEDADMFLKARKEGNTMMHKLLNVGDGLVTVRNKKLVFSTNLPSIKDIDPALIRPGRCHDIVYFGELNQEEAQALADKVGIKLQGEKSKWSVAEIFNEKIDESEKKLPGTKMGFV